MRDECVTVNGLTVSWLQNEEIYGTPSESVVPVQILVNLANINRIKVELLIRLFDLRWETRFSILSLRTFGEVEPFLAQDGTSDKTNTIDNFHNSGSNETMQKVLASIVQLWWIFPKNLGG